MVEREEVTLNQVVSDLCRGDFYRYEHEQKVTLTALVPIRSVAVVSA